MTSPQATATAVRIDDATVQAVQAIRGLRTVEDLIGTSAEGGSVL